MDNWNLSKEVLPFYDDIYEVILGPLCIYQIECYYDGKGFLSKGEYVNAISWRNRVKDLPKKYGKVT